MEGDRIFYLTCDCGCGNGMELTARNHTLYARWFQGGAAAERRPLLEAMRERAQYLGGNRLLRELLVKREDLENLKAFLESVEYSEEAGQNDSGLPVATIKPMHLMDDIYALWLEGSLTSKEVLKGNFYRMFDFEVSEVARDALVAAIPMWMRREEWHSIPDGISPHVTKFTKQYMSEMEAENNKESVNVDSEDAGVQEDVPADTPVLTDDESVRNVSAGESIVATSVADMDFTEEEESVETTGDVEDVDFFEAVETTDAIEDVEESSKVDDVDVIDNIDDVEDVEDTEGLESIDDTTDDVVEVEPNEVSKTEPLVVTSETPITDLVKNVTEVSAEDDEEIPEADDELEAVEDVEDVDESNMVGSE